MSFENPVNEEITTTLVRMAADAIRESEIISTVDAINRAKSVGLDLVAINPEAEPPVCKIIDYGKFKYDLSKREKAQAKKARESRVITKEIQLRLVTDKNDVDIKAKKVKQFLEAGNKVKIVVKFRGRETSQQEMGLALIQNVLDQIGNYVVEKESAMNGRDMVTILAPNK